MFAYLVKEDEHFDVNFACAQLSSSLKCKFQKLYEGEIDNNRGALYRVALNEQHMHNINNLRVFLDYDILLSEKFPRLDERGQLCLDMDMTSVQIEGIDELARRLGVFDKVSSITHSAMEGHLDFNESLIRRVSMLKGGSVEVINEVRNTMPETPGLNSLLTLVKTHGWVTGICSGGFEQLISALDEKYHFDLICANSLEIADGYLTGKVDKRIVNADVKSEGVLSLKEKFNIRQEQIIVVGDGANDLKMIEIAGLGVAYHAKTVVQKNAPFALNHSSLAALTLLLELFNHVEE